MDPLENGQERAPATAVSVRTAPSVELLELEPLNSDDPGKNENALMPMTQKTQSGFSPVSEQSQTPAASPEAGQTASAGQTSAGQTSAGQSTKAAEEMPMLDGFCPVALVERNIWVRGNAGFSLRHDGQTYFFQSQEAMLKFQNAPEFYALVFNGMDIVLMADQNKTEPGSRKFGLRYKDRNYVFKSQENREAFKNNPDYFISQLKQNVAASRQTHIH